jgi:SAM-dependent methyltransferase
VGKTGWNEVHGGAGFENFSSRDHLERSLEMLRPDPARTEVLEYGCGTGPGACFLAARGFRVDAIDLIPRAIALARRFAAERGLEVRFAVADVCALADVAPSKRYDLIVDSYCLQSVVLDRDRARLFEAVRARLKADGHYVLSTAMLDPERVYGRDERYDAETGVVLSAMRGQAERYSDAVLLDGVGYIPNRRHFRPEALAHELHTAGFEVVWQGGKLGGDVICRLRREDTWAARPQAIGAGEFP